MTNAGHPVAILGSSYLTVLAAEVVGDKTLYTLGVLAPRHRAGPLLVGALAAVTLKMGAAVAAGGLVATLSPRVVLW